MLFWLGREFADAYGPLRLLTSLLFLTGLGTALAAVGAWMLLSRLWHRLPTDGGRAHAIGAASSIGKPVGAGLIFIPLFLATSLLFIPPSLATIEGLLCVAFACVVGFLDDLSPDGFSEYRLAILDLAVAAAAAAAVCQLGDSTIWIPFLADAFVVPAVVFVPAGTVLIWFSINATNCSDGVDGLSGSLCALAFIFLGAILYGIVGHSQISTYLLVPHDARAARWAMLAFVMVGCLAGYLWHNAPPSSVLMGDAGSRPLGLLVGILVLASGNPFLIFVVAGVVLANGATGLLKVALLRFLNIGIFGNVRYPLHDHVRHKHGWSNTQVLVRFMLLQAVATPILLVLLMKVR